MDNVSIYISIGALVISLGSLLLMFRKFNFDKSKYIADRLAEIKNQIGFCFSELTACNRTLRHLASNMDSPQKQETEEFIKEMDLLALKTYLYYDRVGDKKFTTDPVILKTTEIEAAQILDYTKGLCERLLAIAKTASEKAQNESANSGTQDDNTTNENAPNDKE